MFRIYVLVKSMYHTFCNIRNKKKLLEIPSNIFGRIIQAIHNLFDDFIEKLGRKNKNKSKKNNATRNNRISLERSSISLLMDALFHTGTWNTQNLNIVFVFSSKFMALLC